MLTSLGAVVLLGKPVTKFCPLSVRVCGKKWQIRPSTDATFSSSR